MEKNKTGKYFKYAIGEIILVVIGILIALQINNWNQSQADNKRLNIYKSNLLEDLELDKSRLEQCLEFDLKKIDAIDRLIDPLPNFYSDENEPYKLNELLHTYSLIIHEGTFISITSGNGMELFKNIGVSSAISTYYSKMKYVKRFEDSYISDHHPLFLDFLNKNKNPKLDDIRGYLTIMRAVSGNEVSRYKDLIQQNNELGELLISESNE